MLVCLWWWPADYTLSHPLTADQRNYLAVQLALISRQDAGTAASNNESLGATVVELFELLMHRAHAANAFSHIVASWTASSPMEPFAAPLNSPPSKCASGRRQPTPSVHLVGSWRCVFWSGSYKTVFRKAFAGILQCFCACCRFNRGQRGVHSVRSHRPLRGHPHISEGRESLQPLRPPFQYVPLAIIMLPCRQALGLSP